MINMMMSATLLETTSKTKEEAQHALKRTTANQQLKDRIAELNAQHGWVVDSG